MAIGARAIITGDVVGRRDMTTIRGVDTTERIFYVSPYWLEELLIRNNGTNDVQIRLSDREKPITVKAGGELNIDGEFAYFLASAGATQNIEILYRPSRKLIAKRVPPIGLFHDGVDDYVVIPKLNKRMFNLTLHIVATPEEIQEAQYNYNMFAWFNTRGQLYNGAYHNQLRVGLNRLGGLIFDLEPDADGGATLWTSTIEQKQLHVVDVVYTGDNGLAEAYLDFDRKLYKYTNGGVYDFTKGTDIWLGRDWFSSGYSRFTNFSAYTIQFYDITIEPQQFYDTPLTPQNFKHLLLWLDWSSIDIVNSTWYDESGFENHGTIYGASLKELWRPEQ